MQKVAKYHCSPIVCCDPGCASSCFLCGSMCFPFPLRPGCVLFFFSFSFFWVRVCLCVCAYIDLCIHDFPPWHVPSSILDGACSPARSAHVFNQLSSAHEIRFSSIALLLGPVHMQVGIFTNTAFRMWFGLSPTSKRIFKSLKTELLENFFLYLLHVHRKEI